MDYLKKSRIEEVLIAILGKGTVTSQLISRIEKILDAIRVKGSYDGIVMSEVEEILVCILLGERFEKPTHSRIAAMLKVKANGGEYTELRKSRVEELIFEWIEGTSKIITYTGTLPATLQTVAGLLESYKIWGNTVQVGERTGNLFDVPIVQGGVADVGTLTNINTRVRGEYISVQSETQYTICCNKAIRTIYAYLNKDRVGLVYSSSNQNTTITFTTPANCDSICVAFMNNPNTAIITPSDIEFVMLNLGSIALPYEPYGYKLPITSNGITTDIYIGDTQLAKDEYVDSSTGKIYKWADITGLSEPLCGIDTYTDSLDLSTGTLTRKIKKLVLTGGEWWGKSSSRTGSFYLSIGTNAIAALGLCDRAVNVGTIEQYDSIGKLLVESGGQSRTINLWLFNTDLSINDFKAYLQQQYAAGTPVTVWYVLAEPEISTVPVPSGLTGTIDGYLMQDGTPTPESPIYPTANGAKQADGTYTIENAYITPTDQPAPLPQIPTFAGETIIDYGIAALPHVTGLDGIFEYGNIDGLTWKNSVSGENDIIFDTAVTDTGAEYVLPTGASGQYTSKSGEYRTAFTWYCIAKCPTTCHNAGQYMVSNWNNQGVEISSGWAAYSSIGGNHLVRSINNQDFNSAEAVTSYALIVVSGDVNGVASVYINGEKKTDSWNFNPVSSDRAAAVYLGKRASGQLSGTDIDYKFLAFGTVKQTDEEIIANSQYLMTKYLGVGRPEKVELTYKTP